MKIAVVVGNPKAGSRTLTVAVAVAQRLQGSSPDPLVVDLADHASELFVADSPAIEELLNSVAKSDVVVVASPTYKATYTGLLKAFLDRYPNEGLVRTVCIPVMTGAAPIHALAPEVHLRPLLVELGTCTPRGGCSSRSSSSTSSTRSSGHGPRPPNRGWTPRSGARADRFRPARNRRPGPAVRGCRAVSRSPTQRRAGRR